jgi:hypothetical protein
VLLLLEAALDAPFYSASSTESIIIESVCASDRSSVRISQIEALNGFPEINPPICRAG